MNKTGRDEIFAKACRGDLQALAFLNALFAAADTADDLQDQDRPARVADLWHRIVTAQGAPFFLANAAALRTLLLCAGMSWDLSNAMELGPQQKFYAEQIEQVLFYVALLCGGYEHAKSIASEWIAKGA